MLVLVVLGSSGEELVGKQTDWKSDGSQICPSLKCSCFFFLFGRLDRSTAVSHVTLKELTKESRTTGSKCETDETRSIKE